MSTIIHCDSEQKCTLHCVCTEKAGSRSASRQSGRGATPTAQSTDPNQASDSPSGSSPSAQESSPHSWTLDHVAEVVYLCTQVQMTNQTVETLVEVDNGNHDTLQVRKGQL